MNQINNSASILTQQQTKQTVAPSQTSETKENDKRLLIEITPGEKNVSAGDKSLNTIEINAKDPNYEYSSELSREQLMQGLEKRFYQQAFSDFTGKNGNSAVKQALVQESLDSDITQSAVQAKQAQNNFNTYTNAVDRANGNSTSGYSSSSSQESSSANKYVEYQQQMMKQELFFSHVDRLDIKG